MSTEHAEAVVLMRAVAGALAAGQHPELALLFAIPNGGHRTKRAAGKVKAEGVKRGVPDYFLPVPRGGFHGLFVELKTTKGRPTREQRQWLTDLQAQGYRAVVCRRWEPAFNTLIDYLALGAEPEDT